MNTIPPHKDCQYLYTTNPKTNCYR